MSKESPPTPSHLFNLLHQDEKDEYLRKYPNAQTLESLPFSALLVEIVQLRSPFILMVREVVQLLTILEAYIRGNVEMIVLGDEGNELALEFGPQLRKYVAEGLDHAKAVKAVQELQQRLVTAEQSTRNFLRAVRPEHRTQPTEFAQRIRDIRDQDPRPDPLREIREEMAESILAESVEYYGVADGKHATDLMSRLDKIGKLTGARVEAGSLGNDLHVQIECLRRAVRTKKEQIARCQSQPRGRDENRTRSLFNDSFHALGKLEEALLNVSRQREAEDNLYSFMKLEIWRERWRIYELWLLSRSILFPLSQGATISSTDRISGNRWNLKFSRDKQPVLRLCFGNAEIAIFYQLHSEGTDRDNMPDIAIQINHELASKRFVVILDPKDGSSYTNNAMLKVCKRYAEVFNPLLSCVANYFGDGVLHDELSGPIRQLVVGGVSPLGEGLKVFDAAFGDALEQIWGEVRVSRRTVVLFDNSESTVGMRRQMLDDLCGELARYGSLDDWLVIPFAGKPQEPFHPRMANRLPELEVSGADGTNFIEALKCAADSAADFQRPACVWLLTDGDGEVDTEKLDATLARLALPLRLSIYGQVEACALAEALKGKSFVRIESRLTPG